MKYLINLIKNLIPKEIPKPVGRWRIEKSNSIINNKIDLSNVDHCGPCGQYALEKIKKNNNVNNANANTNANANIHLEKPKK